MKFILKTKIVKVYTFGDGVKVALKPIACGDHITLEAYVVLVFASRTMCMDGLGLDKIKVETDMVGRILVNERFAMNVPGVYVIGDVNPGPMLAHKAEEDGVALCRVRVVYTNLEVTSIGKRKEQVKALAIRKSPFLANSKAKAIDNTKGLVKILAKKEMNQILGVHIMAPNAGELIHKVVLAL